MAFFEKRNWKNIASAVLLLCSVAALLLALNLSPYPANAEVAAQKVQKVLTARMKTLDSYVEKALTEDNTKWMDLGDIPDDMVVYRYVNDSLQSWANIFTINNDDLSRKVVVQQFTSVTSYPEKSSAPAFSPVRRVPSTPLRSKRPKVPGASVEGVTLSEGS